VKKLKNIISLIALIVFVVVLLVSDKFLNTSAPVTAAPMTTLDSCRIASYFSPDGGCEDAIVGVIDDTRRTLDCAIYTFTSREIAQALIRAHERGVSVRIINDRVQASDKYAKKRYLEKSGVPIRTHIGGGIFHNKFLVADSITIITGSYNWTASANESNYENIVIIESPALAKTYEEQFGKLWDKFE